MDKAIIFQPVVAGLRFLLSHNNIDGIKALTKLLCG